MAGAVQVDSSCLCYVIDHMAWHRMAWTLRTGKTLRPNPSASFHPSLPASPYSCFFFLLGFRYSQPWTNLSSPTTSEVKAKHDESLPLLALGSPADNGRRYRHSTETSTRMTALAVLITSGNGTAVAPDKNQRTFVALGTARVSESTLFPIPDLLTTSYGQWVF